jgi:hypothetical protein
VNWRRGFSISAVNVNIQSDLHVLASIGAMLRRRIHSQGCSFPRTSLVKSRHCAARRTVSRPALSDGNAHPEISSDSDGLGAWR